MSERIAAPEATALAAAALRLSRVSDENAEIVARALVAADLDGLGSHGLPRLIAYCDQAACGKVDGHAVPAVSHAPGASVIKVDAADGFAFPAIEAGLSAAAEAVAETGVIAVAVSCSHHCGVLGHHVEWLARRGLVGLMVSNSPAAMAPWGGRRALFGTNPIAFGAPNGEEPLVVDLSLSKVARGKLMLAKQRGEPLPEGVALDPEGRPTTDADLGLRGTVLPFGDAKGAALALAVEILAATLTGANHGFEASSFLDDRGGPPRVGQLILVFDPAAFSDDFSGRLGVLLAAMAAEPGVRLPGARRYAIRRKNLAEGLALPSELVAAIRARAIRPEASPGTSV